MKLRPPGTAVCKSGFTMVELLVSTAVLALLVTLIAQLFSSAASVATLGGKRMDADAQSQAVFDRLAIDLGVMPKRLDMDYYTKDTANLQAGNDQIAFFSEGSGYYPSDTSDPTTQSPLSLISYRLNDTSIQLERMGKGLVWTGANSVGTPVVYLPLKIKDIWAAATNQNSDGDYEVLGPQVFRFEYGYLLAGRTQPDGSKLPAMMSATPWDSRPNVGHTELAGFKDVAAVVVTIAVIDPRSRVLASDNDLKEVAANMKDFDPAVYPAPGDLEKQWQSAIGSSSLPLPAKSSLRVYHRSFPTGH